MIMETLIELLGYAIVVAILSGAFYIFYKILEQGFKAFMKHDD